jgi:OmcA/MtrC family decaheme c-type cytochrome
MGFILCAALLAGCSGDDGSAGAAGAPGPAGPAGPSGPSGPGSAVPIGSVVDENRITAEITSVTVPAGGGAPVVDFTLTNDLTQGLKGLPPGDVRFLIAQLRAGTAGASSDWQSYISRTEGSQLQGNAETGAAARLVDNGDGSYRYTFAQALTAYTGAPAYDAALTHRVSIEVRNNAPTINPSFDFVPAGGAPTTTRAIVDNDTCNACHDVLEFHGGARSDTENCVTCHNPSTIDGSAATNGNSVDMKVMIHRIHGAEALTAPYAITGYGNTVFDAADVHYPQDVRNCATCHDESDAETPQASNWRLVANRASCGSCHDADMANKGDPGAGAMNHPGGLTFNDDAQCLDCHGPAATVNGGDVQVAKAHEIPIEVASTRFAYEVVSVTDTSNGTLEGGETPRVTVRVVDPTNGNAPYDIQAADSPFRASNSAALRVDLAWTGTEFSNIGSASNSNPPNQTTAGNAPFQPTVVTFASGVNLAPNVVNNGDGTFSVDAFTGTPPATTPFVLPDRGTFFPGGDAALRAGGLVAIAEGRPILDADGNGSLDSLQVAGTGITAGWDGDSTSRPSIVDITRCNECHEVLSLHGGNRTDNTQLCSTCHNPSATDIRMHVAAAPARCNVLLGDTTQDVSIDFRFMIHAIHAAGRRAEEGALPYEVCGHGNSAHVYVSDETPAADFSDYTASDSVVEVDYPGKINNCESCHVPPTASNPSYYGRDPAKMLAQTTRAGADRTVVTDDTANSPTVAACIACHTTSTATAHMTQNGGVIGGIKLATGQVTGQQETCLLCHGPGRTSDLREAHRISFYPLNNP